MILISCFSCKTTFFADYSSKTLVSKGKKIDWITIKVFPLSSIITTSNGGVTPVTKDCNDNYTEFKTFSLEQEYYESLIEQKFYDIQEKGLYKDRLKFLEDSLLNAYPKPVKLKKINLLDNNVKFREFEEKFIDNFLASKEFFTLKEIIKPNHFYIVKWGNSNVGHGVSAHDTYFSDKWLEFQVNEKGEIIYWKELEMKLHTMREPSPL